ncbi:MAG: RDD family protein, partial [Acidimicrobiales bacterium]
RTNHLYLLGILVAVAELLYFAILDGSSQSVGKRAAGIALRSESTGRPIGFWPAIGRWLIWTVLWYLFFIPGLLNALSPLWDSKRQTWHDHAVGSLVVQVR